MPRSVSLKTSLRAVSNAVQLRRNPRRFIQVDKTPWDEIYRDGIMALRHYSLPPMDEVVVEGETIPVSKSSRNTPVILVPALGIQAWTFDLMPDRSMVRYLMARGFDVYVIDWGQPSLSDREINLASYVIEWLPAAVQAARQHSGAEQVSLVGYCMGGLQSLMYLGAFPDAPVRNLATIASPVNFHKGGASGKLLSLFSLPALKLHQWFEVRLEPLDTKLFHVPASALSIAFKLTNPPGVVSAYLDLFRNLADREYVTDFMTMGHWFNDMVDYPGATVRELIEKVIIANGLAGGRIRIGDRQSVLAQVHCNLLAIAGDNDKIVNIDTAREILSVVGSTDRQFQILPGGHAGVFAGSKAPGHTWKTIADWLAERD